MDLHERVREFTRQTMAAMGLTLDVEIKDTPDGIRVEIALLKGIGMFHVLNSPERQARRAVQRELLTELVEALWATAPRDLDAAFAADFQEAADDDARLRVIIDQVASLTDPSALSWHTRLTARRG